MQIPESNSFLDMIRTLDPKILVAAAVIMIASVVQRIRSGAALDPFDAFRPEDDEQRYGLEDLRQDLDSGDRWNRPPGSNDCL